MKSIRVELDANGQQPIEVAEAVRNELGSFAAVSKMPHALTPEQVIEARTQTIENLSKERTELQARISVIESQLKQLGHVPFQMVTRRSA